MCVHTCGTCVNALSILSDGINLQGAVVGRFVRDMLRCGSPLPVFRRAASSTVADLMQRKVADFNIYLTAMPTKLDNKCVDNWKKFGCFDAQPMSDGIGAISDSK